MSSLSIQELNRLTSELASFARSDVPMPEGLRQLESNLSGGKLKSMTGHLAAATDQGQPLSEALASSPVAVPPSFAALVRCGEMSGDMSGVLDFALQHGRRIKQHRASMATLLVYPMLVILVLIAVMAFGAIFILPRFYDIYNQLGAELPMPTQILMSFTDIMETGFGILIPIVLVVMILYVLIAATMEKLPARMMALIPGARRLVHLSDTAVMTAFVGHLLERGVPLPEACRAASLVVYHDDMRRSIKQMAVTAEQGGSSADELNPHMPATAAWLYRQGEERGTLAETCVAISRYCENRFDLLSRRTQSMVEPLFILVIAVVCGFAVIALYLPLFNIPKIVGF